MTTMEASVGLAEEVWRLGGGRPIAVGSPVDFVYKDECYGLLPLWRFPKQEGGGLLPQGEPIALLEVDGDDAKISTRSHGEVWTYLAHLRPRRAQ
jgi:hypothetical protein